MTIDNEGVDFTHLHETFKDSLSEIVSRHINEMYEELGEQLTSVFNAHGEAIPMPFPQRVISELNMSEGSIDIQVEYKVLQPVIKSNETIQQEEDSKEL